MAISHFEKVLKCAEAFQRYGLEECRRVYQELIEEEQEAEDEGVDSGSNLQRRVFFLEGWIRGAGDRMDAMEADLKALKKGVEEMDGPPPVPFPEAQRIQGIAREEYERAVDMVEEALVRAAKRFGGLLG